MRYKLVELKKHSPVNCTKVNEYMKFHLLALFLCFFSVINAQTHKAKIITNQGTIIIELYDGTPLHRDNFIQLANRHYYDSLLFHRVINGFVIQAGDPYSKNANPGVLLGDSDLGYTIPAEFKPEKYFHKRGAVGMARDDNPAKASSACQFYIVQGKVVNDSTFVKAKNRSGYEITEETTSDFSEILVIAKVEEEVDAINESQRQRRRQH